MTAPQEKPAPFSRDEAKQIRIIRKSLSKSANPDTRLLDKQIRNFAKGNAEERAALKPQITKNIQRLEKARADGR